MVADPRMLGGFAGDRERLERETYFTERACIVALYRTLQRLGFRGVPPLPRQIWEPAAGGNAIAAELEQVGHDVHASDVVDYAGSYGYRALRRATELRDFLADRDYEPFGNGYAIVTNPPFDDQAQGGRTAELFLRAALAKPRAAAVWFLLRNDYDLSKDERPDLFDRPDYALKIPLRWRPAWTTPKGPIVSERTGKVEEARHAYAWFGWFLNGRQRWPGARIVYADEPRLEDAPIVRDAAARLGWMKRRASTPTCGYWHDKDEGGK